jgi:hypothetical protein
MWLQAVLHVFWCLLVIVLRCKLFFILCRYGFINLKLGLDLVFKNQLKMNRTLIFTQVNVMPRTFL